jgi:hypothetical protein
MENVKRKLLSEVKALSMLDTIINMKFYTEYYKKYFTLVRDILDKSESKITLNILFEEGANELKLKPFNFYEDIYTNFYAIASTTRFINDKRLYIVFPQLYSKLYTKDKSLSECIVTIYSKDIETIKINKEDLNNIKDFNLEISNVPKIVHNDAYYDKSKLNLFHYDSVALGGSFDHLHIGHNVTLNLNF